jgi:hypothetical protein
VWLAKIFVGLPDGETNEKGNADSPKKAARLTALDRTKNYHKTII